MLLKLLSDRCDYISAIFPKMMAKGLALGSSPYVWAWILLFHRPCHPAGLLRGLQLPYLSNSNRGMKSRSRRGQPFFLGTVTLSWGCSDSRRILATHRCIPQRSRDELASLGAFHFSPCAPENQKLSLRQVELVSTDKCTKKGWFSCANRRAEVDCGGIVQWLKDATRDQIPCISAQPPQWSTVTLMVTSLPAPIPVRD